jgi:hypothetical protein
MPKDFPELDDEASQEVTDLLRRVRDGLDAERALITLSGESKVVHAWLEEWRVLRQEELDPLNDRVALALADLEGRSGRFGGAQQFWAWLRDEVIRGGDAQRKKNKRAARDRRERERIDPEPDSDGKVPAPRPHDSRAVLRSEMARWESLVVGPEGSTREDAFVLLCNTLFRVRLWRILSHPNPKKNHFGDVWLARLVYGSRQTAEELTASARKINGWLQPYKTILKRAYDKRMIQDSLDDADDSAPG